MFKIYIKQTLVLLRQNLLISVISILGTAMALMMVMVVIITQHISNIPMAPEINRDRTLYVLRQQRISKDTINPMQEYDILKYELYKQYIKDIPTPEKIGLASFGWAKATTTLPGSSKHLQYSRTYTDHNYWNIMQFDFIEGKAYNEADCEAGIKKVVITQKVAKELFGSLSPIDKQIEIDFTPHTVCGVVKNVSPIFTYCEGDLFVPVSSKSDIHNLTGYAIILAKSPNDFDAIIQEVRNTELKYNADNENFNLTFMPATQLTQYYVLNFIDLDEWGHTKRTLLILGILFIIPAINLSSFSMSQIKKRIEEIGIRKAFGATKYTIVTQVLFENLITSLAGGFIGLLMSVVVIHGLRAWLLEIPTDGVIPVDAYISPFVFFAVFLSCILLNLISAGIPALRTLRMNIVDSLNQK